MAGGVADPLSALGSACCKVSEGEEWGKRGRQKMACAWLVSLVKGRRAPHCSHAAKRELSKRSRRLGDCAPPYQCTPTTPIPLPATKVAVADTSHATAAAHTAHTAHDTSLPLGHAQARTWEARCLGRIVPQEFEPHRLQSSQIIAVHFPATFHTRSMQAHDLCLHSSTHGPPAPAGWPGCASSPWW